MVNGRPYTLLSCAMSVDGYIDDASARRLVLSNEADLDRVDAVRAECDAILVGANTIRRDDPRLMVRSPARIRARVARGAPATPCKVTMTKTGRLPESSRFFTAGDTRKLVYAATPVVRELRDRLSGTATVVDAGLDPEPEFVLDDLGRRGVERLLVEGGGRLHTRFLTAGLADELHLVVAPFFVGDGDAPRFVYPGGFRNGPRHPMRLMEVRPIGDVVLLNYRLDRTDP